MPRTDNHLVRLLVMAGAGTLGRLAPRGNRMTAAAGTAFTATMRVIDRVLRDATSQRALPHPATAASLGKILVRVVRIRYRANRAHAIGAKVTLLTRIEAHDDEP